MTSRSTLLIQLAAAAVTVLWISNLRAEEALAASGPAESATPAAKPPVPAPPTYPVHFTGIGGIGGDFRGISISAATLVDTGGIGFGVAADCAGLVETRCAVGVRAGLTQRLHNFTIRALATGGVNHYAGVGANLWVGDPGVRGSIMYFGAQAMVTYGSCGSQHCPLIGFAGLALELRQDLTRELASRVSNNNGLFSNHAGPTVVQHPFGGVSSLGLSFVGGFDLGI